MGLLAVDGASFDDVTLMTDDPAYFTPADGSQTYSYDSAGAVAIADNATRNNFV